METRKLKRKNGRFMKGEGFWTGKKRPGFRNLTTFKNSDERLMGNKINLGRTPWNKGKPMSDETKKKVSMSRTGKGIKNKFKICLMCENVFEYEKPKDKYCSTVCYWNWLKGKCLSPQTTFKKGELSGEKHFNWKGGITPLNLIIRASPEMKKWRSLVFKRDNFTCQECGLVGKFIEAHHKISFSELMSIYKIKSMAEARECYPMWDKDNGVTLCKMCHRHTGAGGGD